MPRTLISLLLSNVENVDDRNGGNNTMSNKEQRDLQTYDLGIKINVHFIDSNC